MTAYDRFEDILYDPRRLASRLWIEDREGVLRQIDMFERAQRAVFDSILYNPKTLIEKDRQRGITTTVLLAYMTLFCFYSPHVDRIIQVVHVEDAIPSLNLKLATAFKQMPEWIRPELIQHTFDSLTVRTPKIVREIHGWPESSPATTTFHQRMAGGKGQGRSRTYTSTHWTEVGLYGSGSSAVDKTSNKEGADKVAWQSINATVHRADRRRDVVESTANGPFGLFYELCTAGVDKLNGKNPSFGWNFLFFPWFYDNLYTRPVPAGFTPTEDELRLLQTFGPRGLHPGHLVWRREKFDTEKWTETRFRKEYPSTPEDPFLASDKSWFNIRGLEELAAWADINRVRPDDELVYIAQPVPGRRYWMGVDTSGGVGRDWFVAYVLDDTGRMVARAHSNTLKPKGQADVAVKLSAKYNNALILVETNNYGMEVYRELRTLGANLWHDENGKPWWTQRGRAGNSKNRLCSFTDSLLAERRLVPDPSVPVSFVLDPLPVQQLLFMAEQEDGNIEAPEGKHDDHAMALMLALWCARPSLLDWRAPAKSPGSDPDVLDLLKRYGVSS